MVGSQQDDAVGAFLIHAEDEDLASDRPNLAGWKFHDRDDAAAGEFLGGVQIGEPSRGSHRSQRTKVDHHPVGREAGLGKRLASHHGSHPDVDGEELRRIDLRRRGRLSTHAAQCIGTPILARGT
jgi:hypothetical protein